jgi:hypothetical protein
MQSAAGRHPSPWRRECLQQFAAGLEPIYAAPRGALPRIPGIGAAACGWTGPRPGELLTLQSRPTFAHRIESAANAARQQSRARSPLGRAFAKESPAM